MTELIIATAIGTVLAAAGIAIAKGTWARRTRPLDWMASGKTAVERRRRQIDRGRKRQLIDWVLQRTGVLQLQSPDDLPVKVHGTRPAVITLHPTGRTFAMYPDQPSYRAAAERREVNPVHAHYGAPPPTVHKWSEEKLRGWLHDHADQLPPEETS